MVVEVGLWWWCWVVDWVVFVVVVGYPKPLLWAVVVGCGGGVVFFFFVGCPWVFFVAGFVGLLNFGCFYV